MKQIVIFIIIPNLFLITSKSLFAQDYGQEVDSLSQLIQGEWIRIPNERFERYTEVDTSNFTKFIGNQVLDYVGDSIALKGTFDIYYGDCDAGFERISNPNIFIKLYYPKFYDGGDYETCRKIGLTKNRLTLQAASQEWINVDNEHLYYRKEYYIKRFILGIPQDPGSYMLQKGEELSDIAKKYKVSVKELKEWNNIKNDEYELPKLLYLYTFEYIVKEGETLEDIAQYYGVDKKDIIKRNKIKKNEIKPGQELTIKLPSAQ